MMTIFVMLDVPQVSMMVHLRNVFQIVETVSMNNLMSIMMLLVLKLAQEMMIFILQGLNVSHLVVEITHFLIQITNSVEQCALREHTQTAMSVNRIVQLELIQMTQQTLAIHVVTLIAKTVQI
jgi:hypothetical protein